MRLVDTHTHLYLPNFVDEQPDAVSRAIDAGVEKMIFPNVDLTTVKPMIELAQRYPENVSMAMGLHPTEVKEDWRDVMGEIEQYIGDGKGYVAVGEIGIDLYWDKSFVEEQMQVFERQVAKAIDLNLPAIIHCRDGLPQALEVLQGLPGAKGVF
ncbi:MAG: TatD family hydrolase, partial [Muribaculaceae bacterium]|nr:TatD family hydrolase [Muribaculaceae bacterium]